MGDLRGDFKEEFYTVSLPKNTPGVWESVLQVSSADDGWETCKNYEWVPFGVLFASHCNATLPHVRSSYPFGRDPGDEPSGAHADYPADTWIDPNSYYFTKPSDETAVAM